MFDATFIISISVFIGISLFFAGIFSYYNLRVEHKKIIDKIKDEETKLTIEGTTDIISPDNRKFKNYILKFVSSLGNRIKPKKEKDIYSVRTSFLQAGYRQPNTFLVFFGFKALLAILLPVIFFSYKVFIIEIKAFSPAHFMTLSILLALIGFYLPNLWLKIKIARRQEKIFKGFPDALDLMVVCVEAGMGLDAAINRVGKEMELKNEVLSEEFRVLSLELRAGKLRRDALRNLAMRTGLEDVSSLVTLLTQTDKFGTSVAQALRVHSDSMRIKRYQKAEEIAAKLPVKLVFPIIFFIFPSIFIVTIGPSIIRIYRVLWQVWGK